MPARKPRAPKSAPLPPPLPAGLLLTDLARRQWRLGAAVGAGGFGQIYSAAAAAGDGPAGGGGYVVKVEQHASGPLFSELNCYLRVAREQTISAWQRGRGLARLGMPRLVGSGSLEHAGQKFRFLVMERFGSDLQKLLDANSNRFPMATILHVGLQVLDVLEYLHDHEFIHGDVKGQNLLLGVTKDMKDQVFLIDFGLACHFATDGVHRPDRPDPRRAHNGTIEFTSRDAHRGAVSRRGDLEVLGYNLLQWAAGRLPWQDRLRDVAAVHAEKERLMGDVPALVAACAPAGLERGGDAIQRFVEYVAALRFEQKPDYDGLREILRSGLRALGSPPAKLHFTTKAASSATSPRRGRSPLQPAGKAAVSPSSRRRAAAAAAASPKAKARGAKSAPRGRGRKAKSPTKRCDAAEEEEEEEDGSSGEDEDEVRAARGSKARGAGRGRGRAAAARGARGARPRARPADQAGPAAASEMSEESVEVTEVLAARSRRRSGQSPRSPGVKRSVESPGPNPATPGRRHADKKQRVAGRSAASVKSASLPNAAALSNGSSVYENINPAMQEVLNKRAAKLLAAAASGSRGRGKSRPAAAVSAPAAARGRSRLVGAPARPLVEDSDEGDSFHTPPTEAARPGGRRSGHRGGATAQSTTPLLEIQPRRPLRHSDAASPELW